MVYVLRLGFLRIRDSNILEVVMMYIGNYYIIFRFSDTKEVG